jgi:hypothetical protein
MVNMRRKQRGITAYGLLFVFVVLGFALMMLLKLGPAYMKFWTLKSVMDGLQDAPEILTGGRAAIVGRLDRLMDMNEIDDISPSKFKVEKVGDDSYKVQVAYEQREHLMANVDAVLTFTHAVTVKDK